MTDPTTAKIVVLIQHGISETNELIAALTRQMDPRSTDAEYLNVLRERVKVDRAWIARFEGKG
jgi:hypothetical protein